MQDNPLNTIYSGDFCATPNPSLNDTPKPPFKRPANKTRNPLALLIHYLMAGCCAGTLYLGLTNGPVAIDLRPERWYPQENAQTNENRISLSELPPTGILSPDKQVSLTYDSKDHIQIILSRNDEIRRQRKIQLGAKRPARARWIDSHHLLIQASGDRLEEMILASTDWQRTIRILQSEEEMVSAAPNGRTYLTRQLNRIESRTTPEVKVSWTIRFQDLEGKTINSTVIPAALIHSAASPDGTIIIDANSADIRKGMGPNQSIERQGIYLFTPPAYQLEMIIKDASMLTITDRGRLAFFQYEDKTSRSPTSLEEMDLPSLQRRIIGHPSEPYEQHKRRTAGLAALIWGIALMGIYGVAIETNRTEKKKTGRELPISAGARCAAMIGAQTACLYTAMIHSERFMTAYNTSLPITAPTRMMQAGTLLAIVALANSLVTLSNRLKHPKSRSFLRLLNYMRHGKPPEWTNETESYGSTCLEIEPASNEILLAKDKISEGDFERARIHSYNAVELSESIPNHPEFSFFHAAMAKLNEAIDDTELRSGMRGAPTEKRSAILECLQAYRLSKGRTKEAEAMTDEILSGAGAGLEGAQLHQARVHTAIGSERANELWQTPLERIIATTNPESFTRVQGGTSEVVKISAERNPYAEKTVILKRSKDGDSLAKEHKTTAEISRAVGGINGMSSLPLAYIDRGSLDGAAQDSGTSYLALLFVDGPTLQERAKAMGKAEIERYLRDEALPRIARYHTLLYHNIDLQETRLPTMDYLTVYDKKFAMRVTDDAKEQAALRSAGEPIAAYLSSLGRSPIHGDLHSGNIITPKMILIDPADATIAHESLDIAHLLYDPSLRQDPSGAVILFDHYQQLRGHDPQAYRAQDAVGTAHRLCHLAGRDVAYHRPDELAPHARTLLRITLTLPEMNISGINKNTLAPIETVARKMAG